MSLIRGVALALALTAMATAAAPPAPKGPSAFAVAMLRRDGVLVPFAVHDRGKWSAPWPPPGYRLEAPLTFEAIQRRWWGPVSPATTWIAWPAGQDPRAVHVRAPVVIPAHCLSTVGLQTDYRSPGIVPPPTQHHHPKDGVAITGDETIVPIDVLQDTSPDWARTLELITPAIEKAESKEPRRLTALATSAWRRRGIDVPLKLEVLCRSKAAVPGEVVFYFEAARQFRPGRGVTLSMSEQGHTIRSDSGVDVLSQGFVVLDGQTIVRESITSTVTTTARDDINFGLPLGSLTLSGVQYWVMQFSGRGRERYAIVEAGARNVRFVVDVLGGGC